MGQSILKDREAPSKRVRWSSSTFAPRLKGNPVNIPEPERGPLNGDVNEPGDVGEYPGESYLFFLTCPSNSEIGLSRARVRWAGRTPALVSEVGASSTVLENPGECYRVSCLVVLITAAGLQGEQPLVDRTM